MSETMNLSDVDSEALVQNSYRQMVEYLENILTRQVERLRRYDLDGAMELAEEVNQLAATIGGEKILEQPEFDGDRNRIKNLYKDLCLIIASERQEVKGKLRQIRQGIKALGVYGDNL